MKILCLLVVLANIFLLLWEYRAGAFTIRKDNVELQAINGREPILLAHEMIKKSQPLLPSVNQPAPVNTTTPDSNLPTEQNTKNTAPATVNPTEQPKIEVP